MRFAPCLLLASTALLFSTPACRNVVEGPDDAGAEGEGEGEEGEGEGEGEDLCPPDPVVGLTVAVSDNVTLFRVCTATVTIREGGFEESLTPNGSGESCDYRGARDRPGIYEVTAAAEGYLSFSVADIVVEGDDCGKPIPRAVTVRLNPDG
jgi:hypothetical protein